MLGHAQHLAHREFRAVVRRWELLTDADGADRSAGAAHEGRDAQVAEVGDEIVLRAHGATGRGAVIREVFERFVAAEWDHDWAVTRDAFGDDPSAELMPRSNAQRRFDAWLAICTQAASAMPGTRLAEPLVNVVVDVHTLDALLNSSPVLPNPSGATATGAGTPLDPTAPRSDHPTARFTEHSGPGPGGLGRGRR